MQRESVKTVAGPACRCHSARVTEDAAIRARLEAYYDTAPRGAAKVEEHGPLTLFVAPPDSWPYYARPRLELEEAATGPVAHPVTVTPDDVRAVLARQDELGVARALEWVHQTTPSLLPAARAAGLSVEECPLLVLDGVPISRPGRETVRLVGHDDPALRLVDAAISVGFGASGTATGPESVAERDARAAEDRKGAAWTAARIAAGTTVLVGAFDPEAGPVGGGSHNPRGEVTEIVGIGVLPAYRRRGIAAAITAELARHALATGVTTVFCSAQTQDVARVYEGVGFRRVGTACIAEQA